MYVVNCNYQSILIVYCHEIVEENVGKCFQRMNEELRNNGGGCTEKVDDQLRSTMMNSLIKARGVLALPNEEHDLVEFKPNVPQLATKSYDLSEKKEVHPLVCSLWGLLFLVSVFF